MPTSYEQFLQEAKSLSDDGLRTTLKKLEDGLSDFECKYAGRRLTADEANFRDDLRRAIGAHRAVMDERFPPARPLTVPQNATWDGHSMIMGGEQSETTSASGGRTFRSLFGYGRHDRLDSGGFKDAAEFVGAIESGRYDPRLVRTSMGETTPSLGGFSVPTGFSAEWLDASLPNEVVRNLARVFPMTENVLLVPGWASADMSAGATHGGFTMTFMAEGSTATPQTPKMRQIRLEAKTAAIYCDASIELVQDGRNFTTNLQAALTKSIGHGLDRYCLTGVGAGVPQGVLSAPCKIEVAAEGGQQADTIIYANLKKMFARQLNPGNAVWLANESTKPELLEQSIAIGTGGSFVPVLNESNGKYTIFGRPVFFHPAMPAVGDAGDIAFVDFGYYALGLRAEVALDISDAPRWLQRERSFRILIRFDAQPTLDVPITPEHGATLSPIVTLAARA